MITYVSNENDIGPDDEMGYIWDLGGPVLFCRAQLVRTNFLYPYQMLSFCEMQSFAGALRGIDHEISVPRCPGW